MRPTKPSRPPSTKATVRSTRAAKMMREEDVGLARGQAIGDAIRDAKAYVTRAIREGFAAGRGVGQLRHFIAEW